MKNKLIIVSFFLVLIKLILLSVNNPIVPFYTSLLSLISAVCILIFAIQLNFNTKETAKLGFKTIKGSLTHFG
jgi:hypothetical protein